MKVCRLALLAGALFITVALATGCASAPGLGAAISPGQWEGEIQGQVYDQSFRLPVTIELREPLPEENNPMHLFVGTGSTSQIGDIGLYSAYQYLTPETGREVTLQYFSVEVQGSQLKAVLTDEHASEGAKSNIFVAPNVTGQATPPGPGRVPFESYPTELFTTLEGAEVVMDVSRDKLNGSVRGSGQSLTGPFPLPDVNYQAEFVATRVD